MSSLEDKIARMKALNDDAIAKLTVAVQLATHYKNKSYSLPLAINDASLTLTEGNPISKTDSFNLNQLVNNAVEIKGTLSHFDPERLRKIKAISKTGASTTQILEDPLDQITKSLNSTHGIFPSIKSLRDSPNDFNAVFFELLNDIEQSYRVIAVLIRQIKEKWYRFITGKRLILLLLIITIVSVVFFFVYYTDFNQGKNAADALKISVDNSVKSFDRGRHDDVIDTVKSFSHSITTLIGKVPQLLALLTVLTGILQRIFVTNKTTSRTLSKVSDELGTITKIVKNKK